MRLTPLRHLALVAAVMWCAAFAAAAAEEAAPDASTPDASAAAASTPLSLAECIEIALRENLDIKHQEMLSAKQRYDVSAVYDDFHAALIAVCGDEPLRAALRPVKRALLRYEQVFMADPERLAGSVAQHDGIIDALERGDHAEAAQRLRSNLTGGLGDLEPALER